MTGEIVSIIVAILWTASAVFFEYAGHRIKAMNLNLIRLVFAFILLGMILMFISGSPLPLHTDLETWHWLSLSGFVGFVFGDFFLFSSYRLIPARYTQLIMTLAPPFAAISGFLILGERLTSTALAGMVVTLAGIAISILKRGSEKERAKVEISTPCAANYTIITKPVGAHRIGLGDKARKAFSEMKTVHVELPVKGLIFALLASIGQGVGLVLSKQGMIYYESASADAAQTFSSTLYIPLAATQIRIITGIVCFAVIIAFMRSFKDLFASFKEKKSIAASFGGAVVGPVLGVTLSLLAVQHTNTAIASTLMAITPIIILIPDRILYKRRVHFIEVLGAIISVIGVALFFI